MLGPRDASVARFFASPLPSDLKYDGSTSHSSIQGANLAEHGDLHNKVAGLTHEP